MKLKFKVHPPKQSGVVIKGPQPNRFSFEIAGNNNEVVVRSDPYYSLANARRGVYDLYRIMREDIHYPIEKAPIEDVNGNFLTTKQIQEITSSEEQEPEESGEGSSQKGEEADTETSSGGEETSRERPNGFSRHDEVPGDNPDALKPDGD